jgi:hypothetical protein
MPIITYQSILDQVTDSCALTQPLSAPDPVKTSPKARKVRRGENLIDPPPAATAASESIQNLVVTNTGFTGNISIDLKPYQDALADIKFDAYKDSSITSELKSTKLVPTTEQRLGITNTGDNIGMRGALGSIAINSNRVTINAGQHMSMMFGQEGVAIASPNKVNIDAGETITLAAQESLFIGLPSRGQQYTTKKQSQISTTPAAQGSQKGDPTADKPYEPLVLGVKLANLLEDILIVLKNAQGVDAWSPVRFNATSQAELALLANRIPEILSNYAYVDGVSHGTVDQTILKTLKAAQASTPNLALPEKITGQFAGSFPGGDLGLGGIVGDGGAPGENGRLDKNNPAQLLELSLVDPTFDIKKYYSNSGVKHYMKPEAAKQFVNMIKAAVAAGLKPQISDTYRTYEVQYNGFDWDLYVASGGSKTDTKKKPGTKCKKKGTNGETAMAFPGTSNHGLGIAVDIFPAATQKWVSQNGKAYGWTWAEGKACKEKWHMKYAPQGPFPPQ